MCVRSGENERKRERKGVQVECNEDGYSNEINKCWSFCVCDRYNMFWLNATPDDGSQFDCNYIIIIVFISSN